MKKEQALFLLLGVPAWILVDGTWSALSMIAQVVPEGYNISSYLMLCLSLGNVVPLLIGGFIGGSSQEQIVKYISVILCLGLCCGLFLSLFWSYSLRNDQGQLISLPLFLLFFVLGSCSASANITHYMFVSTFSPKNTTYLATGMALGSLISGVLAILQSTVFDQETFNVSAYYFTLTSLYIPAFFALFYLSKIFHDPDSESIEKKVLLDKKEKTSDDLYHLDTTSEKKDIRALTFKSSTSPSVSASPLHLTLSNREEGQGQEERSPSLDSKWRSFTSTSSFSGFSSVSRPGSPPPPIPLPSPQTPYTEWDFISNHFHVLILLFLNASIGYGLMPSLISFAAGKFQHHSARVLLLSTSIGCLVDPLCRALTNYYRITSYRGLQLATLQLIVLGVGMMALAILPYNTPIFSDPMGGALAVTIYVYFACLFGFTNTSVFRYFKDTVPGHSPPPPPRPTHTPLTLEEQSTIEKTSPPPPTSSGVQHAYRIAGLSTQAGSLVGTLLVFGLIVSNAFWA